MCDLTLITLLKMQHHYSQSCRENTTPSSDTSPVASYKEVPPPPPQDFSPLSEIFYSATLKFNTCNWDFSHSYAS